MKTLHVKLCIACLVGLTASSSLQAKKQQGFAIVVDPVTYKEAKAEIDQYAKVVEEKENLTTYLILDKWGVPDSIRYELKKLYEQKASPIEGAVFIGDIPIPMIRDAQHLTSAFKMNQETFDRKESSVPSDRFYDDFDLLFSYIDQDKEMPLYHYYSLSPSSVQYLKPEIYSARIKANDENGTTRYQKIRNYLKKAVAQKRSHNITDHLLYFSGNGYVSESMMARIDEKTALLESFPWLKQQANGIEYIDHKRDATIKYRLMSEMQRKDLDIAILHHHGDTEIQYMNDLPTPQTPKDEMENIQLYFRESLRHAQERGKNTDSIQNTLSKRFGNVPTSWFEGAFDPKTKEKDSLFMRSLDLYIEDFAQYNPNARLVILDACFNGSFHKDKYIAGAYLFGQGETMAVLANSVNVLQDKWHDRYVGLMALGMRAGYLVQYNPYLEGHLFGDPTFHFTPIEKTFSINETIASAQPLFWQKQLQNSLPAVQAMALRQLVEKSGKDCSALLLNTFKNSHSYLVRMEALMLLSTYNNDAFIQCLQLAADDSYELVQRFSMNFIARSGEIGLVPALISTTIRNNTSERIEFNVKQALALYPEEALLPEFEKQFEALTIYSDQVKVHDAIEKAIKINANKWTKEFSSIYANDSLSTKSKLMHIRTLRNYHVHDKIPALLAYLQQTSDSEQQIALLEALGWFKLSYRNAEISEVAHAMSQNTKYNKEVRNEALKTYNRLKNEH